MRTLERPRNVRRTVGLLVFAAFALTGRVAAETVTLVSSDPLLVNPSAIATDGVNLYVGDDNHIRKVSLAGGAASTLYTNATPCCVVSLARIGTDLFWIDPNGDPDATAIFRGSIAGTPPVKIYSGFATGQPIVDGTGLTTDGTKLYTADEVQGRVHSLNPDGSGITFLNSRYGGFFDTEHFNKIVHSGGTLFIADGGHPGVPIPPQVVTIPTGGGGFTPLHVGAPFNCPNDIAVGMGLVFVSDPCANTVWRLPVSGGVPTVLVSGAPFVQLTGLAFADNTLFIVDGGGSGSGAIYKVSFDAVCDVAPSKTTYVNGDTLTLQVFRLTNPAPTPAAVELKVWLGIPAGSAVTILNVGATGTFVLPGGIDQDFGPLPLAPVSAAFPRGSYEFGCRLLHPVTGRLLSEDISPFAIQ